MIGKRITVVRSQELAVMKMLRTVGYTGTVVAKGELDNGYYVEFDQPFLNEKEWFVPTKSIQLTSK